MNAVSAPPRLAAQSACDVAPDHFDPLAVDPEQTHDVTRWRRAERTRLRTEPLALSVDDRAAVATALRDHLRVFLSARFEPLQSKVTVVVHLTVAIGVGSVFDLALRLRRRGDAPTDWTKPDR